MNWELFTAFLLITLILVVTPGPIVTLVVATGASRGVGAALTTVAGTTLGNAMLLAVIAFGLSWVLRNAAVLFEILRWAGAAYLIWLGIQAWRQAADSGVAVAPSKQVHFWRGFAVALSNPKTIAFSRRFCHNSSTPDCRSSVSWRSCAPSQWSWRHSAMPAGQSRPALVGPGSCGLGARDCSADVPPWR